ncbi:MAG: N-acetylglucosamine-6-phosphate deacetylase [Chloroflexota bacterium]|jgi:N-acetylglucosamine-6-phosphate deacetylase|nr:N-acetylglucosamine-6-phosphate deacetylase [Chloroflexota bacterium]
MRQLACRVGREPYAAGVMLLTDARVVTPAGVLDRGWLRIDGGDIVEVGAGAPPPGGDDRHELGGRWVVPGFIDLHTHGGGGHATLSADPAEIVAAAAFHRSHGTTRTLASIVSAPLDEMLAALEAVRHAVPSVIGSHLEGPFLSPARAGAHDPRHLLPSEQATFERMLEAAGGTLRVITLAPELPGSIDLVRRAVAADVVVALGHSDADHAQASAAFDTGATLVTHLFNAMRPWHHREPGLVGAALSRADVACELINDGTHLHDSTAKLAFGAAGPGRIALVTDAIAATGAGDGEFQLGTASVQVRDGAARLADDQTLAGSTLTMDVAFRRAVRELGLPIEEAVRATSTTPARVLGIADRVGSIEAGREADLLVLRENLGLEAVMAGGRWITSGRLFHT